MAVTVTGEILLGAIESIGTARALDTVATEMTKAPGTRTAETVTTEIGGDTMIVIITRAAAIVMIAPMMTEEIATKGGQRRRPGARPLAQLGLEVPQ